MPYNLLLHSRTFLIYKSQWFDDLKSGIIPADQIVVGNSIEILGKNSQDEYTYKKIRRQSSEMVEAKTREILTERRLFNIYDNYRVSSSSGRIKINQITEEHKILDTKNIQLEKIQNLLKSTANYPNSYKSYLCGFQNSLLTKFFHGEGYTPKFNNVHYHTNLFFLDLESVKLLGISENSDDNGLLKKIILWHRHKEITHIFSTIYQQKFRYKISTDNSYSSSGIIIKTIPEQLANDLHRPNYSKYQMKLNPSKNLVTPFLPIFAIEFKNAQYFLIGFLTGMIWDGVQKEYPYEGSKTWSRGIKQETNRKMITTKPIRHWMQKDYYLPKILPFFLSFYDMNYEYEYKKKTREIQMTLDISNMPNLLKNNLGNTDYRKFSKVLHIEDHDKSNLISFNIDKMESLWRPILDFTLVEID